MKKLLLVMLAAGSMLTFNACTKTVIGPPGPTGATGPQGPQGNANVVGSDPFTVSSWSYSGSEVAYYASFTNNAITNAVADRGSVEVFLHYSSDNTWRALPDIYNGTQFYSRFSSGGFEIYYGNLDGSTPGNPGTQVFRVVVISPAQRQAHPNTNWKNYNEAMAALNDKAPATSTSEQP